MGLERLPCPVLAQLVCGSLWSLQGLSSFWQASSPVRLGIWIPYRFQSHGTCLKRVPCLPETFPFRVLEGGGQAARMPNLRPGSAAEWHWLLCFKSKSPECSLSLFASPEMLIHFKSIVEENCFVRGLLNFFLKRENSVYFFHWYLYSSYQTCRSEFLPASLFSIMETVLT